MPAQGGEPAPYAGAGWHDSRSSGLFARRTPLAYVSCVIDGGSGTGCDVFSVDVDTSFTPGCGSHPAFDHRDDYSAIYVRSPGRVTGGPSLRYRGGSVCRVHLASCCGRDPAARSESSWRDSGPAFPRPSRRRIAWPSCAPGITKTSTSRPPDIPRQPLVTSTFPEASPQVLLAGRAPISCSALRAREIRSESGWPRRTIRRASTAPRPQPHAKRPTMVAGWSPSSRSIHSGLTGIGTSGSSMPKRGQPHQVIVDAEIRKRQRGPTTAPE